MTSAAPLATLIIGEHSSIAAALTAVLNQLLLMREKSYQLLISDWAMEPVSGLQLLKFVRAEPELAHVRFIIACPRGNRAAEIAIREAGADGVLVEPSSPESIKKTIFHVLQPDANSGRKRAKARSKNA
jgi:DNA-binding response OmpR family regulator